jgi:hypothetical protein
MADNDELYTMSGASDALRRNRRAVRLALRNMTPDDTSGAYPRWRLPRVAVGGYPVNRDRTVV